MRSKLILLVASILLTICVMHSFSDLVPSVYSKLDPGYSFNIPTGSSKRGRTTTAKPSVGQKRETTTTMPPASSSSSASDAAVPIARSYIAENSKGQTDTSNTGNDNTATTTKPQGSGSSSSSSASEAAVPIARSFMGENGQDQTGPPPPNPDNGPPPPPGGGPGSCCRCCPETSPVPVQTRYWISGWSHMLPFFDAARFCEAGDGKLASIVNEEQRSELVKAIGGQASVWTSAVYNQATVQWIWFGIRKPLEYSPWYGTNGTSGKEPTNSQSGDCAFFEVSLFGAGLRNFTCSALFRFVCESNLPPLTNNNTTTTKPSETEAPQANKAVAA